jgi:hypothetical protein
MKMKQINASQVEWCSIPIRKLTRKATYGHRNNYRKECPQTLEYEFSSATDTTQMHVSQFESGSTPTQMSMTKATYIQKNNARKEFQQTLEY